jgi:NAD(P)-dependent dehydrogenase (short-subunit alcohol dehydrogenase family)
MAASINVMLRMNQGGLGMAATAWTAGPIRPLLEGFLMAVVLVTGANRGLGLEFVRQYAEEGWQVEAACRSGSGELAALAARHGPRLRVWPLDVGDPASVAAMAVQLRGQPIDLLLNNAGYLGAVPFAAGGIKHQEFGNSDYTDWERTFRVNVLGPMRMAEAFIGNVEAGSGRRIVTLTSIVGSITLNTQGGLYPYRASKAAVNAVMKSMAIDLRKRGIMATAIHPGWARTDMGGPSADIDPDESVRGMREVIASLRDEQLGQVLAWDGSVLPY